MVGFKGELIHTFNKNENAIHNSTYFEELKVSVNNLQLCVVVTSIVTVVTAVIPFVQP